LLDIILGGESVECGLAIPIPFQLLVILRQCVVKAVILPMTFLCHTCSYTIYAFHFLCNILTVSVMNPGHVNYLH
jgi:arginine exporter protein ArgO